MGSLVSKTRDHWVSQLKKSPADATPVDKASNEEIKPSSSKVGKTAAAKDKGAADKDKQQDKDATAKDKKRIMEMAKTNYYEVLRLLMEDEPEGQLDAPSEENTVCVR